MALDQFRLGHIYTVREAARFAGFSTRTVGRWLQAYDAAPVFGAPRSRDGMVSFMELAELVVAAKFRRHGGKLEKIRAAHETARKQWPELPYPFASLRLKQIGGEIIHAFDETYGEGKALALSLHGRQWVLPALVNEALDLFDFEADDGMARRWFPAGREVPIVLDPRMAGGRLTFLDTGITIDTVVHRFMKDNEALAFIARDLSVPRHAIEAALRLKGFAAAA
jgi:uncharacterized protein (DUF433 family)